MKKLLLIMLGMLSTLTGLAEDFEYTASGRTISYTVISDTENTVKTKNGTGNRQPGSEVKGDLVIPSSVTYNGKSYRVTEIGAYSFSGNEITSVKVPTSVKQIGEGAFQSCYSLTKATLSNYVITIGVNAFSSCRSMTSIDLGSSVTTIGKYAFSGCLALTSISIPGSVTTIGYDAFYSCMNIKKAEFASIESFCNIKFESSNSTPMCYAEELWIAGVEIKELEIPEGMTSIGSNQFSGCGNLTSVKIPGTVTSIERYAFSGCFGLTKAEFASIESVCDIQFKDWNSNPIAYARNLWVGGEEIKDLIIPSDVRTIKAYAFRGCDGLASVTLGDSVSSINHEAFSNCNNLTSISIPASVTSIGEGAFSGCDKLKKSEFASVESLCSINFAYSGNPIYVTHNLWIAGEEIKDLVIPETVTSIGKHAFEGCSSLTSVTFSNHLTDIGESAFEDCTGLTSLEIPASITQISKRAFRGCRGLTSVVLPNTITIIELGAFQDCSDVPSFTIPNSVLTLEDNAFRGCKFTSITIPDKVSKIGFGCFQECSDLATVTLGSSIGLIEEIAFARCPSLRSLKCKAVTPPDTFNNTFDDSTYLTCELQVPDQSVGDYSTHYVWQRFMNISPAAVETLSMDKNDVISVYSLSGEVLYNEVAPESAYSLSPGTYIILQRGEAKKIIVR